MKWHKLRQNNNKKEGFSKKNNKKGHEAKNKKIEKRCWRISPTLNKLIKTTQIFLKSITVGPNYLDFLDSRFTRLKLSKYTHV